jgi:hypothetical protein
MELMRPRLAIDSADRMKLEIKRGQNREDAGVLCRVVVEDASVARWKCCVMPILTTLQMRYQA